MKYEYFTVIASEAKQSTTAAGLLRQLRLLAMTLSFIFLLTALPACAAEEKEPLTFGLISTETSQNLKKQWEPLIADMEKSLGRPVKPFFASDYAGVIEAMRFGKVDLAWYGNKSAMEAVDRAGGEVFAQIISEDGYPGYHSVLIVNKASPLKTLDDLLKSPGLYTFGNGDPNSTSGFLVPSYYVFALNKIDPKTHFKRVVNGSHEVNALAVANGQLDVATNNTHNVGDPDRGPHNGRLWKTRPDMAENLRIIWKSPLIPNEPLVYRKALPDDLKKSIRGFLFAYGKTPQEKAILANIGGGLGGFKPADDTMLKPMRELEDYKAALEGKK